MMKQHRRTTKEITLAALLVAVITICSQIQIPLVVPINFGLFAICLTAGLLERKHALLTVGGYLLAGALGLPVFAGFMGGPSALMGKTGGYLLGYLLLTWIVGWGCAKTGYEFWSLCAYMFLGTLSCYFFGTLWFVFVTGIDFRAALLYCVAPFVVGDILKIALAANLTQRLRRSLY